VLLVGAGVREFVLHPVALGPACDRRELRAVGEPPGRGAGGVAVAAVAALAHRIAQRVLVDSIRVVVDAQLAPLVFEPCFAHAFEGADRVEHVLGAAGAPQVLDDHGGSCVRARDWISGLCVHRSTPPIAFSGFG
jgi:hypothetical protein